LSVTKLTRKVFTVLWKSWYRSQ